jgi:aminopeptidase
VGQRVEMKAEVEHAPVARALARAAYDAGASIVSIEYLDQQLFRAHLENAPEESRPRTAA